MRQDNIPLSSLSLGEREGPLRISSSIRFTLLIMQIMLTFFRPLSLAGRKGYGKMMQIGMV